MNVYKISNMNCCVPQCSSRKKNDRGLTFHRFPGDMREKRKWICALRIGKEVSPRMTVCSKHFVPYDFFPPGIKRERRKLKKRVIPSQCLPIYTNQPMTSVKAAESTTRKIKYQEIRVKRQLVSGEQQNVEAEQTQESGRNTLTYTDTSDNRSHLKQNAVPSINLALMPTDKLQECQKEKGKVKNCDERKRHGVSGEWQNVEDEQIQEIGHNTLTDTDISDDRCHLNQNAVPSFKLPTVNLQDSQKEKENVMNWDERITVIQLQFDPSLLSGLLEHIHNGITVNSSASTKNMSVTPEVIEETNYRSTVTKVTNMNCCVPQCSSRKSKDRSLTFHRFPCDMREKRKWICALRIGKEVSTRMTVCSKHFVASDFFPPGIKRERRKLKKRVIPSRCIPIYTNEPMTWGKAAQNARKKVGFQEFRTKRQSVSEEWQNIETEQTQENDHNSFTDTDRRHLKKNAVSSFKLPLLPTDNCPNKEENVQNLDERNTVIHWNSDPSLLSGQFEHMYNDKAVDSSSTESMSVVPEDRQGTNYTSTVTDNQINRIFCRKYSNNSSSNLIQNVNDNTNKSIEFSTASPENCLKTEVMDIDTKNYNSAMADDLYDGISSKTVGNDVDINIPWLMMNDAKFRSVYGVSKKDFVNFLYL